MERKTYLENHLDTVSSVFNQIARLNARLLAASQILRGLKESFAHSDEAMFLKKARALVKILGNMEEAFTGHPAETSDESDNAPVRVSSLFLTEGIVTA